VLNKGVTLPHVEEEARGPVMFLPPIKFRALNKSMDDPVVQEWYQISWENSWPIKSFLPLKKRGDPVLHIDILSTVIF